MREIKIFTPKKKEVDTTERVKSIIGKKILGKNGDVVGKVKDIITNNERIEGILVKKKWTKFFIDYEYIDDLYADSVLLLIDPAVRYLGMKVFDVEGRLIGRVVDIQQKNTTNIIENIIIKKHFFSKPIKIPIGEIEISDKNIILNTAHD